jgi:outer membrane protein assembly factor BamB
LKLLQVETPIGSKPEAKMRGALAALILLAACGRGDGTTFDARPWPDARPDGSMADAEGVEPCALADVVDGVPLWDYQWAFSYPLFNTPAIAPNGTIVMTTKGQESVFAFGEDGQLRWTFSTGRDDGSPAYTGSPAIASDGTIYVTSFPNGLYALNGDGTLRWRNESAWSTNAPAIASDGTVYTTNGGGVHAVDPAGTQRWIFTAQTGSSSPSVDSDGNIYVGTSDGIVYALRPDGSELWHHAIGAPIQTTPAIGADGTVFVGADDGGLRAIAPGGLPSWTFYNAHGAMRASPVVGPDGTIFVGDNGGELFCNGTIQAINSDGSLRWSQCSDSWIVGSGAVGADLRLYIGVTQYLVGLSTETGCLEWVYDAGQRIRAAPMLVDGRAYIASNDTLHAVGSATSLATAPWPHSRFNTGNEGRR